MFQLPEEIKAGAADYKASLDDLLAGKISPARFSGIRVPWGFYSHRGGKVYMSRLRIPAGQLSARTLGAIGSCAQKFASSLCHITTRQDIQIHNIKIEDTAKIIEYLKDFNLSSRGGGGNTLRNVTSCALSGACNDELFCVGDYAISLSEFLLRQESSFNLPRKLKIAFSGCGKDCAGILVNDIGLLAVQKDAKKGFKVFAGGGMGQECALGFLLEEFVPEEDIGLPVCAIKNIFYKKGDRRNKHHNRLRFLIKDIGHQDFIKLYQQELKYLKENEYFNLRRIACPALKPETGLIPQHAEDSEYKEFLKYNILPQVQDGYVSVELRIPRGDISAQNLEKLAGLEKDFPAIEFRAANRQNLFICNVKNIDAYNFFTRIKSILNNFLYPNTLLDMVCCKGASTCNLGLCNSPALTERLETVIKENFIHSAIFSKLNIRINGCPNSCGGHPLGLISFVGAVRKVDARPVPFYRLFLCGRAAGENSRLAKDTGILIPAKNLPGFLKEFILRIEKGVDIQTDIYQYIEENGLALAEEILNKYAYVPAYSENRDFYVDWGKDEDFSLAGLGPGECGAGVLDMINADLTDAASILQEAPQKQYPAEEIKKALFFCSRALLVVKGLDPKEPQAALSLFIDKFVKEGIADPEFIKISDIYKDIGDGLSLEKRQASYAYAKKFLSHINDLNKSMDASLNFPKKYLDQNPRKEEIREGRILDLRGTPCPINYVKAKLYLENLNIGDAVVIYLDEGKPISNVPVSLKNDGQEVLGIEKQQEGFYLLKVRKQV